MSARTEAPPPCPRARDGLPCVLRDGDVAYHHGYGATCDATPIEVSWARERRARERGEDAGR